MNNNDMEDYDKIITKNVKEGVMFDPSFFAFKDSKNILIKCCNNLAKKEFTSSFYLPNSLLKIQEYDMKKTTYELFSGYNYHRRVEYFNKNLNLLDKLEKEFEFKFWKTPAKYENIFSPNTYPNEYSYVTQEIIMQELSFLIEHSAVFSKMKRVFHLIMKAGVTVKDLSKKPFKKKKEFFEPYDHYKYYILVATTIGSLITQNLTIAGINSIIVIFDP